MSNNLGAAVLDNSGMLVASWRAEKGYRVLRLLQAEAETADGAHVPATPLAVVGAEQLKNLLLALDQAMQGLPEQPSAVKQALEARVRELEGAEE